MSRRRPFKKIVGHEDIDAIAPWWIRESAERVGKAVPNVKHRYDVLECGHKFHAVFVPRADRNPYRHLPDKTVLRRCTKCPMEVVA